MVISDSQQQSSRKMCSSLTNRDDTCSYLEASKYAATNNQPKQNENKEKAGNRSANISSEVMKHTFAQRPAGGVMTGTLQKKKPVGKNSAYNSQAAKSVERKNVEVY